MAGMIPVCIPDNSDTETVMHIIKETQTTALILDTKKNLKKFTGIANDDTIKFIILLDHNDSVTKAHIPIYSWMTFLKTYNDIQPSNKLNDTATIIYNNKKETTLTHNNISSMIRLFVDHILDHRINKCKERFVSYLPLAHSHTQLMDIYLPIITVGVVYIKPDNYDMIKLFRKSKPTILCCIPGIINEIADRINKHKKSIPLHERLLYSDDTLQKLGLDECRYLLNISRLYHSGNIGIDIINTYGMNETSGPIAFSIPNTNKFILLDEIDIKIINNIIHLKGPTTNDLVKTDDIGYLENGYLFIMGKLYPFIITARGDEINPQMDEEAIKKIPLVKDVVIIGNGQEYQTALITLKLKISNDQEPTVIFTDEGKTILKQIGSKSTSILDAIDDAIVIKYLGEHIMNINKELKWKILDTVFTIKYGELNNNNQLQRDQIYKKYGPIIYNA